MTLLTICQDAADVIGIARPSTITSNSEAAARQLGALARQELSMLANSHDWQQLVSEGSVTLATGDADYALPSDFLRLVRDTTWDRNDDRKVALPLTPQEWAFVKGEEVTTTANRRARIIGGEIEFSEVVVAGDNGKVVYFEYISSNLALNVATPTANLTADAYTARLPEHLVTLGVIWRYKQQKGLEWNADFRIYEAERARYHAWQGSSRAFSMDNAANVPVDPYSVNLPDLNFPSS